MMPPHGYGIMCFSVTSISQIKKYVMYGSGYGVVKNRVGSSSDATIFQETVHFDI
jgi:hypothetical protein